MKKPKITQPPNWEDTPQSFDRFERLAKGLMAVPKKELDKELARHERKRPNTRATPSEKKPVKKVAGKRKRV